jgi:choline dehydrogenase
MVDGKTQQARATEEIILTAGTFVTPKLLMLSGIGPKAHLEEHGITTKIDLPGVGQNLQDHHLTVLSASTTGAIGYFGEDRGFKAFRNLLQYLAFNKSGPIGATGSECMAFVNLDDPKADPDIQIYCVGIMWPSVRRKPTDAITLMASLLKPKSRGHVKLRSANPKDQVEVDLKWLSDPSDQRRMLQAFKYLRKIAATAPLSTAIQEILSPENNVQSDEALLDYIRQTTESNYHPVGTCRMGVESDPLTVVTPDLKVKGLQNLRIFDASMMPVIISANTNATVMAVAEKGVDLMMRSRKNK